MNKWRKLIQSEDEIMTSSINQSCCMQLLNNENIISNARQKENPSHLMHQMRMEKESRASSSSKSQIKKKINPESVSKCSIIWVCLNNLGTHQSPIFNCVSKKAQFRRGGGAGCFQIANVAYYFQKSQVFCPFWWQDDPKGLKSGFPELANHRSHRFKHVSEQLQKVSIFYRWL